MRSRLAVRVAITVSVCAAGAVAGCATDEVDSPDGIDEVGATAGKSDGSQLTDCEKTEILELLNGGATKEALRTAGVHATAASNLVAHRDGADGAFGTADDDRFDSIDEVDGVAYVGPVAFQQLAMAVAAACAAPPAPVVVTVKGTCSVTRTTYYNGYGTPSTSTESLELSIRLESEDETMPLPRDAKGTVMVASPWGTIPEGLWRGWCNRARGWGTPPYQACAIGPFEISTSALWFGSGDYSRFLHDVAGYQLYIGAGYEVGRDSYYDGNFTSLRYSCSASSAP